MNVMMLLLDLLIPLIFFITAVLIKRFPPRFGSGIGYRTSLSERNELTWNTAQWLFVRYAAIFMIPAAVIGAAGGIIGIVMNFDEDTAGLTLVWINLAQAVLLFAAIILTEVGLHKRFDKYGNPK
ncbi:MAG: hypothetical protein K2O14_09470 [Oscillospiraceae bacterium]|nr:hypothetical protein [Oscillospiraceae bacterium]